MPSGWARRRGPLGRNGSEPPIGARGKNLGRRRAVADALTPTLLRENRKDRPRVFTRSVRV